MDQAAGEPIPVNLSPADAFGLLGSEHRVAILQALLDLHRTGDEYPASFSTLRAAADIEVSSQFSYHLSELTGHFLKQTDRGYAFRYAGWNVATAIVAGTYNQRGQSNALSIDGECPLCTSEGLTATYRDEWMQIECSACMSQLTRYPFPPGGLANRSPAEFLRIFDRQVRTDVRLARDGICPACTGPMQPALGIENSEKTRGRVAGYWCERCGNRLYPRLGMLLLEAPVVRKFYRSQDRDVDSKPYWEFRVCVDESLSEVIEDRPWQCEVRIPLDDTLVVELDEELNIVSTVIESD